MKKESVWTQKFMVSSFLVNPQKRLGIYSLLNLLQDAAWMHATHLGHGHAETAAGKTAWVLTRQKVKMETWPAWGDSVTIRTWVRPLQGPFAVRDFEILHDEKIIGSCTTSWVLMNIETRTAILGKLDLPFEARSDFQLDYDAKKISITDALEPRAQFEVRNSDLDMNEHVNNTRYVQWILDSIPRVWHNNFSLREYEVNFLAEAHSGDHVDILMSPERPDEKGPFVVQFQGVRNGKSVFSAELKVNPVSIPE
jgi:acyl-ACP thioesterase